MFEEGTNNIISAANNPVHHPSINLAYDAIEAAITLTGISGYNSTSGEGLLKYLNLNVETKTSQVQLIIVVNAENEKEAGKPLATLIESLSQCALNLSDHTGSSKSKKKRQKEAESMDVESNHSSNKKEKKKKEQSLELCENSLWASIWVNYNKTIKHSSRILSYNSDDWQFVVGRREFTEERMSLKVSGQSITPVLYYPPQVFRQANLDGFFKIIEHLREWVPANSNILELYGGAGTIGLHVVDKIARLTCSDINEHNKASFEKSVSHFPIELRQKIDYQPKDATEMVRANELDKRTLCIVDPARKGLEEEVLASFLKPNSTLKRIIYISCGFNALMNNLQSLIRPIGSDKHKKPIWKIVFAEGHILFPGADHIENLVVLDRNKD